MNASCDLAAGDCGLCERMLILLSCFHVCADLFPVGNTHTHTHGAEIFTEMHIQTQASNGSGRVLPFIPPLVNSQNHESTKGTNHMARTWSNTELTSLASQPRTTTLQGRRLRFDCEPTCVFVAFGLSPQRPQRAVGGALHQNLHLTRTLLLICFGLIPLKRSERGAAAHFWTRSPRPSPGLEVLA